MTTEVAMQRRTLKFLLYPTLFAFFLLLKPLSVSAQQPYRFSPKQVRLLLAHAESAADYQKLSSYFHYQELLFRAKRQTVFDYYANHTGKFTMAAKFWSRADVNARLSNKYACKAEENAKIAGRYDEMLANLGVKPVRESAVLVNVKSLRKAPRL